LRILQAADRCAEGELGALLRREGLYSSHLTIWRKQREIGQLAALASKKRGRKTDRQAEELARLRRENRQLQTRGVVSRVLCNFDFVGTLHATSLRNYTTLGIPPPGWTGQS
jgi:hypothetical protein